MIRAFRIIALLLTAAATAAPAPSSALDLERRRMLSAAEHQPWRAVGRVNVATAGELGMCTGTLIREDLVITAAHCVVSDRTGQVQAPGNVHFVAGWRRGQKVGHSKAREIFVHPSYRQLPALDFQQIAADLALIRLADPIPIDKAPFFPVGTIGGPDRPLTLISYRRDRAHALTRQDGCDLTGARESVMVLDCDVTFGASGSPIFAESEAGPEIVGVVSAKGKDPKSRRPIAFAVRVDLVIDQVMAGRN